MWQRKGYFQAEMVITNAMRYDLANKFYKARRQERRRTLLEAITFLLDYRETWEDEENTERRTSIMAALTVAAEELRRLKDD